MTDRFSNVTPAIIFPILMVGCLVCIGIAGVSLALSPPSSGPLQEIYAQLYVLANDSELNTPIGDDDTPRAFEVLPGSTANDIGIKLVTEGFITNGTLFSRYAQVEGLDDDLVPGVFYLNETMDIPEILTVLTDPSSGTVRFVIRENMRIEEIAAQIDATPQLTFTGEDFLSLVRAGAPLPAGFQSLYGIPEGASLEGFLYPATYSLPNGITAEDFVQTLTNSFQQAVTQDIIDAARAQGRSIFQVVIIASIVEREAVVESERPTIAAVYWNRVDGGGRLDADPTVQYQLANNRNDSVWWPSIPTIEFYYSADSAGPYNTYQNVGLPPGPIVSPGLRSIRAATFPDDVDYLFFQVSCANNGTHVFFDTIEEHDAYFEFRLNGC